MNDLEMAAEIKRIGVGWQDMYESVSRQRRILYRALLEIAMEDDRQKRLTLATEALEALKR